MSVTAEHIRALMALGIDGEKLLAVVTIIDDASRLPSRDASQSSRDASQDPSRSPRDSKSLSAERSRAYRLRQRVSRHAEPSRSSRDADKPPLILTSSSLLTGEILSEESKKERAREAAELLGEHFDLFWQRWPNKVGKSAALKALRSALKRSCHAEIMAGVENYIRDKPPDRHWLNPATFLNQDRWSDQPAQVIHGTFKTNSGGSLTASIRRELAELRGEERPNLELPVGRILRLSN